jgi:hypothetical protein
MPDASETLSALDDQFTERRRGKSVPVSKETFVG